MNIFHFGRSNRLKRTESDVQGYGFDLNATSSELVENLWSKVKARRGCCGRTRLMGEDSLIAITILQRVVPMDVRWQRHMADTLEDGTELGIRTEAQGTFTKFSCGYHFSLEERRRIVWGSEEQTFPRLHLASRPYESCPLVLRNLLSEQNLDTTARRWRSGLSIRAASARGIKPRRNDATVIENEDVAWAQ